MLLQATSAFNSRMLALAASQSLREDASQLAMGVTSQISLYGNHHQSLLQDVPEGTLRAVTSSFEHGAVCVDRWARSPEVIPAILNLLRPDLLLVAWQRVSKCVVHCTRITIKPLALWMRGATSLTEWRSCSSRCGVRPYYDKQFSQPPPRGQPGSFPHK